MSDRPLVSVITLLPSIFIVVSVMVFPPRSVGGYGSIGYYGYVFRVSIVYGQPFVVRPMRGLYYGAVTMVGNVSFVFVV